MFDAPTTINVVDFESQCESEYDSTPHYSVTNATNDKDSCGGCQLKNAYVGVLWSRSLSCSSATLFHQAPLLMHTGDVVFGTPVHAYVDPLTSSLNFQVLLDNGVFLHLPIGEL